MAADVRACVDEALALWDPGVSRLANEYLGPDIREELSLKPSFSEGCRNVGLLATLTGQREVAVALFRARAARESGVAGIVARSMDRGTFHWCAQVLSLPGWVELFADPCDADDLGLSLTSEALSFPATRRYVVGLNGTVPGFFEGSDRVWVLKQMLMDMAKMAAYRFWPAYNDLGLSAQDFEDELVADAALVRRGLGLSPELPVFEVDERVELPEGFAGLLPYRRVERTSLARRRAAGRLAPAEVTALSVPPGPLGSPANLAWTAEDVRNRQR